MKWWSIIVLATVLVGVTGFWINQSNPPEPPLLVVMDSPQMAHSQFDPTEIDAAKLYLEEFPNSPFDIEFFFYDFDQTVTLARMQQQLDQGRQFFITTQPSQLAVSSSSLFSERGQRLLINTSATTTKISGKDDAIVRVIPDTVRVIYELDSAGLFGSAIVNDGRLEILSNTTALTIGNILSGTGDLVLRGSNNYTVSGDNSHSGSLDMGAAILTATQNSSLGSAGQVISDGGTLDVTGLTLPALSVDGPVTLLSNIVTLGDQRFGGDLIFGDNSGEFNSSAGDITFNGRVSAGVNAKDAERSLTVRALDGTVTINDQIGMSLLNNADPDAYETILWTDYEDNKDTNPWAVDVRADTIRLNADVTTFETQRYEGATFVGNNGSNGNIRLLVSLDPSITFVGSVDDSEAGVHTLIMRAISLPGNNDEPTLSVGLKWGKLMS